jgi:hypothetical protein
VTSSSDSAPEPSFKIYPETSAAVLSTIISTAIVEDIQASADETTIATEVSIYMDCGNSGGR